MIYQNKNFTPIKGYSDYYICKETSEVLSTKPCGKYKKRAPKILKQINNSKLKTCNYFVVTLVDKTAKSRNKFIHRLMAETFLPNPKNKEQVNHIDGNKLNNNIDNLEWVTAKENSQHALKTGLITQDYCSKKVHQYKLSGAYINSFKSAAYAEAKTGIQKTNIGKCCLGLRNHAGGYMWSFIKKISIEPYKGRPIIDYIKVINLDTLESNKEFCSISKLGKKLNLKSKNIEYSIRKKGYYIDKHYKIEAVYLN